MNDNARNGVAFWDSGNNKPAIVWHSQLPSSICPGTYANGYGVANTSTYSVQLRSHCSGYNEEVRIYFSDLTQLQGASYNNMNARVQFHDVAGQTPAYISQFALDTYWLDSGNEPTNHGLSGSGDPGNGRDNMDKMCFNQGSHTYYRPSGSNYSC